MSLLRTRRALPNQRPRALFAASLGLALLLSPTLLVGCKTSPRVPTHRASMRGNAGPSDALTPAEREYWQRQVADRHKRDEDAALARLRSTGRLPATAPAPQPAPDAFLVGRLVTVVFKRDALGLPPQAAAGPLSRTLGPAAGQITGTLQSIDPDWITLSHAGLKYHIPRPAVFLLRSEGTPP